MDIYREKLWNSFRVTIFGPLILNTTKGLLMDLSAEVFLTPLDSIREGWNVVGTCTFEPWSLLIKHHPFLWNIWNYQRMTSCCLEWLIFESQFFNIGGSSTSTPTTNNVTIDSWQNTAFFWHLGVGWFKPPRDHCLSGWGGISYAESFFFFVVGWDLQHRGVVLQFIGTLSSSDLWRGFPNLTNNN